MIGLYVKYLFREKDVERAYNPIVFSYFIVPPICLHYTWKTDNGQRKKGASVSLHALKDNKKCVI